jgi:hypothetical protein
VEGKLGDRVDVHKDVNAVAHEYGGIDRAELPESGMAL